MGNWGVLLLSLVSPPHLLWGLVSDDTWGVPKAVGKQNQVTETNAPIFGTCHFNGVLKVYYLFYFIFSNKGKNDCFLFIHSFKIALIFFTEN